MSPVGGQFSDAGILYWDGKRWDPVVSPDGTMRWDGQAWAPVRDDDPIHGIQLDDRASFNGTTPASGKLPSTPVFKNSGVAIGDGWIATPGAIHWHPVAWADLRSVGFVGPTAGQQLMLQRIPGGSGPELRFNLQGGHAFGVKSTWLSMAVRQLILQQLPLDAYPTAAAGAFMIGFMPRFLVRYPWAGDPNRPRNDVAEDRPVCFGEDPASSSEERLSGVLGQGSAVARTPGIPLCPHCRYNYDRYQRDDPQCH